MKYYIEIDERDIDRFRIDTPCKGSHGNDVLVLEDKYHRTIGFELLKERPHGEWIPMITKDDCGEQVVGYKCKTCGWLKPHDKMPFCENCGADMRKKVKQNEVKDLSTDRRVFRESHKIWQINGG